MVKICFFSVGFAFNRLVRLRYYEKIFPKNVEMFLITTNKYEGTKEQNYQGQWDLKRTKVVVMDYSPIKLMWDVREFCRDNKIDVVTNMGHPFGMIPLIFGTIGTKAKNLLYFFGDTLETPKMDTLSKIGLRTLFILPLYFPLVKLADKVAFVGEVSYRKAPIFFLSRKSKFYQLHAPVDVNLFRPVDRAKARKDLRIKPDEKVILYVGRVSRRKAGRLLEGLILKNPDIKFIVIGRWAEDEIPKPKTPNLVTLNKIPNEELYKYYNAVDLSFAYHLQGYPMGIVGEESLACGTPILHIEKLSSPGSSKAIVKIPFDAEKATKIISHFFSLPEKEKKLLQKDARRYAEEYCSDEYWKKRYLDFYLK
ncbi:MAG: glycosyltransferase [Candidatus Pacearchaeota archaeon]